MAQLADTSVAAPATSSAQSPTTTPTTAAQTTTTPSTTTTATPANSPTTTNAATSSASSSASPSNSSSATSAAATTQSSSTTTSVTPTPTQIVTTSDGAVVTITSTAFVVPSGTSSGTHSSSSNSFFSNKAAVASVFTIAGLIVIALVFALTMNAIRRRRAQKFDRDVAEAAAEAVASSRSPFDDYPYSNSGSGGGGGGGSGGYVYSDNSHGTYQLPPLSPNNEAYGMTEVSQYDPLAASVVGRSRSRKESEPGIAGVGVGTVAREPSRRAPYHAFAGPGPQPHELQTSGGSFRSRLSSYDVLEAAGLAAGITPAALANNNTALGTNGGAFVTRQPSEATQNTHFSGRLSQFGSMSSGGHHPPTLQPGYPIDSYYPQRNESRSPDPFAGYQPVVQSAPAQPLPNPHDAAPSTPATSPQPEHNEEPEPSSPSPLRTDEQRMSYQDDTDYTQGNRVLRVANE